MLRPYVLGEEGYKLRQVLAEAGIEMTPKELAVMLAWLLKDEGGLDRLQRLAEFIKRPGAAGILRGFAEKERGHA